MHKNLHAVLCMFVELVLASDKLRMYVVNIEEKEQQLLAATKLNSDLQTTIDSLQLNMTNLENINAGLQATINTLQAEMSRLNSTINARKFNSNVFITYEPGICTKVSICPAM